MFAAYPGAADIRRQQLPNGATLLAYEHPTAPSVVVAGSLAAGARYEGDDAPGLANLTAGALMRGCQAYDFDALHWRLEGIGADLHFSAGSHRVGFTGKALAEDLPALAETLAAVLRAPTFPEDQVAILRDETLTTLRHYRQDTGWLASDAFHRLTYPAGHPYHADSIGEEASISRLRAADLRRFHARVYRPAGLVIAIVGAVSTERALATVGAELADWQPVAPAPAAPISPPIPPLAAIRRRERVVAGKSQTDLVLGVAGPSRFDEDYLAASLANGALGEFGMMGRIGETIREREGLSYYAYSRLEGGDERGPWCAMTGVAPARVSQAVDLLWREIQTMRRQPISAADLADNQAYRVGRLPLQLETNEGIAGALLTMERYNLGMDFLRQYSGLIHRITREDVLRAMQRYWPADAYVLTTAGPGAED